MYVLRDAAVRRGPKRGRSTPSTATINAERRGLKRGRVGKANIRANLRANLR